MAPSGTKTVIAKPACLKRGYFFKSCRRYQSEADIFYDYVLVGPDGKTKRLQARGRRQMLSYNFPLRGGGYKRLDVHRVFAFNSARCNTRRLRWAQRAHVHHHPFPKRRPRSNCCAANMHVMTQGAHEEWHRRRPDVPHCGH